MKTLIAGFLLLAAGVQLHANLLFYDPFDYPAGVANNLSVAASGTWSHAGTTVEPVVQNVGLTFPGLAGGANAYSVQYDGVNTAGVAAHDLGSAFTTGTLYYSLLMKVTAVQVGTENGFATGVNLTQGSFMAGLETVSPTTTPAVGSSAAPLLIRSGDGTQYSSTYQLGTSLSATAVDRQFYTGQSFTTGAAGETVFVVLKYSFDAANGDRASLFINPTPGGAEPAAQLSVATGTALALNSGIGAFFLRNNSVEPDQLLLDELRIGTTWGDVTPLAIPEPSSAVLLGIAGLGCLTARRLRRV